MNYYQKTSIFYENIEDKDNYLEFLEKVLSKYDNVTFYKEGIIIPLCYDMNANEIEKEINKKTKEFASNNEFIEELDDSKSLLFYAKYYANQASNQKKNYSIKYHNGIIRVVPGSTDFDFLYQCLQINLKYIETIGYEEMESKPYEEFTSFGDRIYSKVKSGRNILANFNKVIIPFTTDLITKTNYNYIESDVWTFVMMFAHVTDVLCIHFSFESNIKTSQM